MRETKDGTELTFAIRRGQYYIFTILVGVACLLFFGYWLVVFTKGWIIDREEILIGGVIFYLVMLGGFLFGVYTLDRMLHASSRYVLGENRFIASYNSLFKRSRTEIDRKLIVEVLRLYTPPKNPKLDGRYQIVVAYRQPNAQRGEFALEDYSEEAAAWAGPLIAQWADVKMKRDYAPGFEEADADEDAPDHVREQDE
jgi:hypothetical protein